MTRRWFRPPRKRHYAWEMQIGPAMFYLRELSMWRHFFFPGCVLGTTVKRPRLAERERRMDLLKRLGLARHAPENLYDRPDYMRRNSR